MYPPDEQQNPPRRFSAVSWGIGVPALYVLSSGPVLAAGCWLREETGWDGFYAVFWLYWPLFLLSRLPLFAGLREPADAYVSWWFEVFDTVGPG